MLRYAMAQFSKAIICNGKAERYDALLSMAKEKQYSERRRNSNVLQRDAKICIG